MIRIGIILNELYRQEIRGLGSELHDEMRLAVGEASSDGGAYTRSDNRIADIEIE
jgi:hypothetical protein